MDPHPGRHRARERHAADARERHRDVRTSSVARSVADIAWFWDAVVQDLGIEFTDPYVDVVDRSRGPEWATWFTQRHDQPRAPVRRPVGGTHPRGGRRRLGRRRTARSGRRRTPSSERSPIGSRTRSRTLGVRPRHTVGIYHADGDRDRRRDHGLREARRDLGADLQRVRPRCGGGAARRRRRPGGDHRRRIPAEGLARRDEGGGRPRARTRGRCAPRRRVGPPSGPSDADDARPRPLVARADRRRRSPGSRHRALDSGASACSSATPAGRRAGRRVSSTSTAGSW